MICPFTEDYYLRGPESGLSNYTDYRWLPDATLPMATILKQFFRVEPDDTLLDFGCARGFVVKALRQLGTRAFGADVSEWAIRNCDPEVRQYVSQDWQDFGDRFDFLFSKDVLEHIPLDVLNATLPQLLHATRKAALFIVPLAERDGGKYLYDADEKDATHIHRLTLDGWLALIEPHAQDFCILNTKHIPLLKLASATVPGSVGFIYLKRLQVCR